MQKYQFFEYLSPFLKILEGIIAWCGRGKQADLARSGKAESGFNQCPVILAKEKFFPFCRSVQRHHPSSGSPCEKEIPHRGGFEKRQQRSIVNATIHSAQDQGVNRFERRYSRNSSLRDG